MNLSRVPKWAPVLHSGAVIELTHNLKKFYIKPVTIESESSTLESESSALESESRVLKSSATTLVCGVCWQCQTGFLGGMQWLRSVSQYD